VDAFPNRQFNAKVKQIRINPTTQQNVVTYDVVVDVHNDDLVLLPGMTAYVNIVTAQKTGVLLVPNSALRFKPPVEPRKSKQGKPKQDAGSSEKEEKGSSARGTVYVLEGEKFRGINLGIGITDNKVTEILSGDLKEGDDIIVEELPVENGQQGTFKMRMF
jgi:HlyD family secretion protein